MEEMTESKAMEEGQKPTCSSSSKTRAEKVPFTLSNLLKHLPTGCLFVLKTLSNLIVSDKTCATWKKISVASFVGILAIACFVLSLTDTFKDDCTGKVEVHYGIATTSGLKTIPSSKNIKPPREKDYKLNFMDILRSSLAVVVFSVLAFTDKNIVSCLYPSAEGTIKKIMQALPLVVLSLWQHMISIKSAEFGMQLCQVEGRNCLSMDTVILTEHPMKI